MQQFAMTPKIALSVVTLSLLPASASFSIWPREVIQNEACGIDDKIRRRFEDGSRTWRGERNAKDSVWPDEDIHSLEPYSVSYANWGSSLPSFLRVGRIGERTCSSDA